MRDHLAEIGGALSAPLPAIAQGQLSYLRGAATRAAAIPQDAPDFSPSRRVMEDARNGCVRAMAVWKNRVGKVTKEALEAVASMPEGQHRDELEYTARYARRVTQLAGDLVLPAWDGEGAAPVVTVPADIMEALELCRAPSSPAFPEVRPTTTERRLADLPRWGASRV